MMRRYKPGSWKDFLIVLAIYGIALGIIWGLNLTGVLR